MPCPPGWDTLSKVVTAPPGTFTAAPAAAPRFIAWALAGRLAAPVCASSGRNASARAMTWLSLNAMSAHVAHAATPAAPCTRWMSRALGSTSASG